jgi:hypothetical protein
VAEATQAKSWTSITKKDREDWKMMRNEARPNGLPKALHQKNEARPNGLPEAIHNVAIALQQRNQEIEK